MNKIVLGLGAATLIASAGVAVAQDRQAGGERGHMAKIDSNGDGQITRAEMLAELLKMKFSIAIFSFVSSKRKPIR